MAQVPSVAKFIQEPEVAFRAPVSESTFYKIGGSINFILEHYMINPGTVQAFAGPESNIDPGWLPCDGREILRADPLYAQLFAKIGTYWGIGNGVTTFNIPDFRGLMLRMIDQTAAGAAGRDPNAASRVPQGSGIALDVGTYQPDELRSHQHTSVYKNNGGVGEGYNAIFDAGDVRFTGSAGGAETRPKNMGILYIIKL